MSITGIGKCEKCGCKDNRFYCSCDCHPITVETETKRVTHV